MLLNDINSTFASALDIAMYIMVLILEGNSEHVTHGLRKKNLGKK